MNILRAFSFAILAIALIGPAALAAEEDRSEFSAALGAYFEATPEEVAAIWETGIGSEEIAVAMRLSQLVNTSAIKMADLRVRGDSWPGIMKAWNMSPGSLYMIVAGEVDSETYAPILEKYASVPESKWNSIDLTNEEIINFVNLKFLASQYDYSVFKIMKMRDAGLTFLEISTRSKAAKDAMAKEEKEQRKQKAKEEGE